MQMRLLLLGENHLLRQSLLEQAIAQDISFTEAMLSDDELSEDSLAELVQRIKPDGIVNLAYYFDWFQARQVDTEKLTKQVAIVEALAKFCEQYSIILFQPSSYRVFGGRKVTAYTETEKPLPISPLGNALWRMEQAVSRNCKKHILLRFGWLLDYSAEGKIGRLLQRAETLPEVLLADDRRSNPTPIDDAARVIIGILQQLDCDARPWGTYHYGGMEATTSLAWGQVALAEARLYQKNLTEHVIARAHTDFEDAAVEPQYAILACKKILHTFGIKQRAWRTAIPELFKQYYS